MNWKEAIIAMCNTTIKEVDMVVNKIEAANYKKPTFILKVYSDNTYSCYIGEEQEADNV